MENDTSRELMGVVAIIVGILMFIWPQLVGYLVGIFLIIYGIMELLKKV
jgi:uncharacterized membrane protein HdeD (DUF308 family)